MKYSFIIILSVIITISCSEINKNPPEPAQNDTAKHYIRVIINTGFKIPTVGIPNYSLVTNNLQRDSVFAREIMDTKILLPLAMQQHNAKLFDSILSKDFICEGEEEFLNRKEYIKNRVNGKWMISDVRYENVVLQFFGDYGVLTYRNQVKEKDEFGKDQVFHWFWTDIWIIENGKWKLKVLRAIN